ncbi:MAG TPA: histidine kinase [Acidobacteriota bacterium]
MRVLILTSLLVFTFAAVSLAAVLVLWFREVREEKPQLLDWIHGAMLLVCTVWFVLNLVLTLAFLSPGPVSETLQWSMLAVAFLFPPLIMHVYYLDYRPNLSLARIWNFLISAVYSTSLPLMVLSLLLAFRVVKASPRAGDRLTAALFASFIVAALFSVAIVFKARRGRDNLHERGYHRWNLFLFVLLILVSLPLIVARGHYLAYLGLFSRSLPLYFVFVSSYYHGRSAFFDIFIKRGTFFLVALVLLTAYFALVPSVLDSFKLGWEKPWVYALTLLPLALALPWTYRKLSSWLDRAWLGRVFSRNEALSHFLEGVQEATSEKELIEQAEERLGAIFQAETRVLLDPGDSARGEEAQQSPFQCLRASDAHQCRFLEAPVRIQGQNIGVIQMWRPVSETPYFSEDITLSTSLTDIFSNMLENIRLLEKKQQQEKREQDLVLNASRSELKALRAQINPHFLFNALNAIAGLIPKNPSRAEETVEQLAEVFRYTLRRSENEWVRLEDEMMFVRSYLEVERARFGERLQVHMQIDDGVKDAKIPAMIVQTLVENSIKHGIASVRGTGKVEIQAGRRDNRVQIKVVDNGPGFQNTESRESDTAPAGKANGGYGLRNVRQRLQGYFGEAAQLKVERDKLSNLTVVSVEIPLDVLLEQQ